jgi:hypothetical protein
MGSIVKLTREFADRDTIERFRKVIMQRVRTMRWRSVPHEIAGHYTYDPIYAILRTQAIKETR